MFFVSPLVWPWCIYASHNAHTGRPCMCICNYKCMCVCIHVLHTYMCMFVCVGYVRNHACICVSTYVNMCVSMCASTCASKCVSKHATMCVNICRYDHLIQCCPTFLTPRAAQDIVMKPRAAPVNSKVTTKICWTLIYCTCVIVICWNQRLFITYAHATFDKFYPSSVTNCQKSRTLSP